MNLPVSGFRGRRLVIATRHFKERVIAPLLEQALGVQAIVPVGLDTDLLGTFTGEVERTADSITTLRRKCRMAMELSGCDIAVASEGSFGLHPVLMFAPVDEEKVMLLDAKEGLEIIAGELTTETNFSSGSFKDWDALQGFARQAGFPDHGLILRDRHHDSETIFKGLTEEGALRAAFERIKSQSELVHAETDMRAMFNPTRMRVIERAARSLVSRVLNNCPGCGAPGFGITGQQPGLPCELCSKPTLTPIAFIHTCQKCPYSEEQRYPVGKTVEDPMYCDFCNP